MNINDDIESILISEKEINGRCKELAKQISDEYDGKNPIVICPLKGAVNFFANLCKYITIPMNYEFLKASSYEGTSSTGVVNISYMPKTSLTGRHIIVAEDIIDTGKTLEEVIKLFYEQKPASIEIACLLYKPESIKSFIIHPKYIGFKVPNAFVVGFGLDYEEKYRNLPYVGILKPEIYTK